MQLPLKLLMHELMVVLKSYAESTAAFGCYHAGDDDDDDDDAILHR